MPVIGRSRSGDLISEEEDLIFLSQFETNVSGPEKPVKPVKAPAGGLINQLTTGDISPAH